MSEFTHFSPDGASRMVDVGDKQITRRTARARAIMLMSPETLRLIKSGGSAKGNVLEIARLAGIMAAKRTADLIPLCHTLPIEKVEILFEFPSDRCITVEAEVGTESKTGVEMEAMTAVSIACLTIYDMCKSVDRTMVITDLCLLEKSGGRSGHFLRDQ